MMTRAFPFLALALALCVPLAFILAFTTPVIMGFVFFYPLFMSGVWIVGGAYFWFSRERHWPWGDKVPAPEIPGNPLVSVIIPCFNESSNVLETIDAALKQRYTHIEVIAVNDGSKDDTGQILDQLVATDSRLRVIHLARNQGKAVALQAGAAAARSEYLVCIDGDAVLDRDAVAYLVAPLVKFPRVGVVTGNPRVRTRSTLVGRLQVGEFSSIIGLIKRAQRVYGQVFTVSGVVAAFRRKALDDVGYWSPDMITEDIDISWKLQKKHWPVFFEPRGLCWILMPETVRGLWKQRLRWAQGGAEVFIKNSHGLWNWRHRRMWMLGLEYSLSIAWAFTFAMTIVLYLLNLVMPLPEPLRVDVLAAPAFTGMVLASICVLQFLVSLMIDRRYEKNLFSSLVWMVWYPVVYWMLSLFTTLVSFPKVMLTRRKRARWVSPDRGIGRLPS